MTEIGVGRRQFCADKCRWRTVTRERTKRWRDPGIKAVADLLYYIGDLQRVGLFSCEPVAKPPKG